MYQNYIITAIAILFCLTASAQDEIDTDRPDQTETPSIVPEGRFQIEAGFDHVQTLVNASELALPEALWKYGINGNVELRLITTLDFNKYGDSIASGLQPVTIGFKANLLKEKKFLPETSFIMHLTIPKLASKELRASTLAPELLLLFENTLSKKIALGYNIGAKWDGFSPQPVYVYTLSPNFTLTNKLKAFVESFGLLPEQSTAEHWLDGGFMFLVTKNIQLDIAAGYELTSHQHFHQYYETMGISFRI